MWFATKCQPSGQDAAKHLLEMIRKTRYLAKDLRAIADTVIQRSSYYTHHENIILTMIRDERKAICEPEFRRILKVRQKHTEKTAVQRVCVSKLNFDANEYYDLVDWQATDLTEPPATKNMKNEELQDMIASKTHSNCSSFPIFYATHRWLNDV